MISLVESHDADCEIRYGETFNDQALVNEILLQTVNETLSKAKLVAPIIHFTTVTPENLMELQGLNSALFPMIYQNKYYKEVLAADSLARIGIQIIHFESKQVE